MLAFPLTALLVLHADAATMGIIMALQMLPPLLFSIPAGAWVDRFGRRREIMMTADIARAVLWASIPLAFLFHRLTLVQLVSVAFVGGAFGVLSRVSSSTMFVTVVPKDQYLEGGSLLQTGRAVAWLVGPSLAGVLVQWFSAPVAIVADAFSFLVSALSLSGIKAPEPPPARQAPDHVLVGLTFMRKSPILRALLFSGATLAFFRSMFLALYALYAVRSLYVSPWELGIILGPGSVGALWGAKVARSMNERLGLGVSLILFTALYTVPTLLVPLAAGQNLLIVATLFIAEGLSGMGLMIREVGVEAIFATGIPDILRARVNGAYSSFTLGIRPVGAVLGGVIASLVGIHATMWLATGGSCLGVLWLLNAHLRHVRRLDQILTA